MRHLPNYIALHFWSAHSTLLCVLCLALCCVANVCCSSQHLHFTSSYVANVLFALVCHTLHCATLIVSLSVFCALLFLFHFLFFTILCIMMLRTTNCEYISRHSTTPVTSHTLYSNFICLCRLLYSFIVINFTVVHSFKNTVVVIELDFMFPSVHRTSHNLSTFLYLATHYSPEPRFTKLHSTMLDSTAIFFIPLNHSLLFLT